MKRIQILFLSLVLFPSLPHPLPAQSITHLPISILKDEPRLWASPLHLRKSDSKWLFPLAVGTAAFLITDHAVREDIEESPNLRTAGRRLSHLGGGLVLAGTSGGFYGLGKLTHNSRAANTGLLAGQAIIHSTIAAAVLKVSFNRERPNKVGGTGAFWKGGSSFPSGHTAATWSLATVVTHQYHGRFVKIGAYGVAATVAFARVGGQNHYPSDVLVGAAIGSLIGRFVLNHRGHG